MDTSKVYLLFGILLLSLFSKSSADLPCAAQKIANKSVVCVCNATYCDTITKEPLTLNQYVVYMSSKSGLRFDKSKANLQPLNVSTESECTPTLVLNPKKKYQTVEGFGGSVSDAASINWKGLSEPLQKSLIDSYFSDQGLQYNMIRVPIGGTDFSTHAYAYNDLPVNDAKLSNYSLSYEDFHYKIPMIRSAMQASSTPIHVIASTWSPPPWMKTNNSYVGRSELKTEYYQTYADYHLKFLDLYTALGIPIWAITTTNEPVGSIEIINNIGWNAKNLGKWIVNNLGPTMKNSTHKNVKVLLGDDQRVILLYWVFSLIQKQPEVLDYIDGIAVHYYTDSRFPPEILSYVDNLYPDKFIIATEACEGVMTYQTQPVKLGSWNRGKRYLYSIFEDLNNGVVGWIDWNMCLNIEGGPSHANNNADSAIIVFPENNTFIKQPMYYALGHFSKFVPRDSVRIDVTHKCGGAKSVQNVAFTTPENTTVVVLFNDGAATKVNIQLGGQQAVVQMEADSIATIELMNTITDL